MNDIRQIERDTNTPFFGSIIFGVILFFWTGSLAAAAGAILLGMREAYRRETQDITPEKKMLNLPAYEVSAERAPEESPPPIVNTPLRRSQPTHSALDLDLGITEDESLLELPQLIADGICSGVNPGHLFLSCKTGSGKTTTIRAMIRAMLEREPVNFVVADPKGSSWLGLEKGKTLCKVRESSDVPKLLRWVEGIKDILNKRINDRDSGNPSTDARIILILDEWPTLWDLAREAKLDAQLLMGLNSIVRLGREDRVNLWVVGQSHLVTESGFSRTTQNNFEMISLGRGDQLQSVRAMIDDRYVVQEKSRRDSLLSELENLDPNGTPIAFTSSGGGRLGKLPDLRDYTDWTIDVE
ncbi:MAG: type IV secretory system conjugative DNA transfer family protein [Candidatus Nanopelagicaceae bacterium]